MRTYIEERLFLMHNPIWVKSIKLLREFQNDDPDAEFHLTYIQKGKRKEQTLSFNTLKYFQHDGIDQFIFCQQILLLLILRLRNLMVKIMDTVVYNEISTNTPINR